MLDVAVAGAAQGRLRHHDGRDDPPEAMKEIANSPVALPGVSDGGAHTKFVTTARYPTELLGYWVREHEIMSLEEAHWRLSAYPAMAAGLKDRGFLAEGQAGRRRSSTTPSTVDSLAAGAAVGLPGRRVAAGPEGHGYDRIIVNGVTTFIDGECTDATPGKLLAARHGLKEDDHDERAIERSRRSSTPTTTTGRSSDAFTRYRDPKFADRGVALNEVDGKPRYFFGERPAPDHPGPGRRAPAAASGRALRLLRRARAARSGVGNELAVRGAGASTRSGSTATPGSRCMDEQGVEAAWLFPSQGVCMEGPMQPDIEASIDILRAFNRWLDDDWGFAYQDRIFAVPFLTLSDVDQRRRRARVVPRTAARGSSRSATARSSRPTA